MWNSFFGRLLLGMSLCASLCQGLMASDWPTYRGDNRRSGHSEEKLDVERLNLRWVWRSPHPPRTAWAGPAKRDAYRNLRGLPSMRDYDAVFHAVSAKGLVFFGSSVDDSVHCLDAITGKEKWSCTADAPVRIAPCVVDDRVFFGSDDGYAYCVNANSGTLVWKFRPIDDDQRVLNNGRIISRWPCRTGVLVANGIAYFANSMLPWKESYLCAVDAKTGRAEGKDRYVKKLTNVTLEGPLAASPNMLIVPQGRVAPRLFNLTNGASLGNLKGGGGSFVVLTADNNILHGPASDTRAGAITSTNSKTRAPIATYKNGNAIVVSGPMSYMLTDDSLIASDFVKRKVHWTASCDYPYCLILVGDHLFVGGEDEIAAFDSASGKKIWSRAVEGKAYGLSVADKRLLVSTDVGAIYAFDASGEPSRGIGFQPVETSEKTTGWKPIPRQLTPIEPDKDKRLVGRWVFQSPHVARKQVQDLAGANAATISGRARIQRVGSREAIQLDGQTASVLINGDHNAAKLPRKELTAEAWVRVDRPLRWGGIIGAVLDNGSHERGWILGFEESKFSFAICGKEGTGSLTYLQAKSDFQPKQWYHVVGTYDGAVMQVFVNGTLSATSTAQKGEINYPTKTFYEIGAYHDSNEYYRLSGMLHEVRVYDRALSSDEINKRFQQKAENFGSATTNSDTIKLATGPWVDYHRRGSAVVRWHTKLPSPTVLEYWHGDKVMRVDESAKKTQHTVTLNDLKHNRVYEYVIRQIVKDKEQQTDVYQFDTFFNYNPGEALGQNPYGGDLANDYAATALHILAQGRVDRGICVDIGCGNGRLAYELARHSRLRVIGFDTSKEQVAVARRNLQTAGLYGERVSIHHVERLQDIPMPSLSVNLVVSNRLFKHEATPNIGEEVARVLQPQGIAVLGQRGNADDKKAESTLRKWFSPTKLELKIVKNKDGRWARLVKGSLTGTGEWSHLYGSADNSAYSGESLAGVTRSDELRIQWIGRPGPRYQSDRGNRKPSPLSTGGRLFLQGWRRMIAVDAYNGTPLWSLEIPHFERFNMPRDCSNWCADRNHVYAVVRDQCWKIDARNGSVVKLLPVDSPTNSDGEFDWGYVASNGNNLVGTAVRQGTSWTNIWGGSGQGWYDAKSGPVTAQICSDKLFSLDKVTGKTSWEYSNGVILNSTITIGAGRIYFVESRNKNVQSAETRRVGGPELWKDQHLVALHSETGKKIWEKPIDTADGTVVFYMAYSNGKLVINSSSDGKYHVHTFDAAKGEPLWNQSAAWSRSHHGGHMSRPAIVEGTVYVRPYAMDLYTGKILPNRMPSGGCGTYACTSNALFFRSSTITMWDRDAARSSTWTRLRPDCWLSTIPAGGMLLAPEGGGGCSCGTWMETSIGFIPNQN